MALNVLRAKERKIRPQLTHNPAYQGNAAFGGACVLPMSIYTLTVFWQS